MLHIATNEIKQIFKTVPADFKILNDAAATAITATV